MSSAAAAVSRAPSPQNTGSRPQEPKPEAQPAPVGSGRTGIPGGSLPAVPLDQDGHAADPNGREAQQTKNEGEVALAAHKRSGSLAGDFIRSIGDEILDLPRTTHEAAREFHTAVWGAAKSAVDDIKDAYHEVTREPTAQEKQEDANRRSIEYLQEMDRRHQETAEEQQAINHFVDGAIRAKDLIVRDVVSHDVDAEVKKELPTYHYLTRHPIRAICDEIQITLGSGREILHLPEMLAKKATLAAADTTAKGLDAFTKRHGYDHHDELDRVTEQVHYQKTHRPVGSSIGEKLAYGRNITDSPVFEFVDTHRDDITLLIKEGTKATITGILLAEGVPSATARAIAAAIAGAVTAAAVDLAKDRDFTEMFKDMAFDTMVGGAGGYVGGRWQDRTLAALNASPNMVFLKSKVEDEAMAALKAKSPDLFANMSASAVKKLVDDQTRRAVAATVMGRVAKAGANESGQLAVKALGNIYMYTDVTTNPDGTVAVRVDTDRLQKKEQIDVRSAAAAIAVGFFEPELVEGARGMIGRGASRLTQEVAKEQAKGLVKHQARRLVTQPSDRYSLNESQESGARELTGQRGGGPSSSTGTEGSADTLPPINQGKSPVPAGPPAMPQANGVDDQHSNAGTKPDAVPDAPGTSQRGNSRTKSHVAPHAPKPTPHGASQHGKSSARPAHAPKPPQHDFRQHINDSEKLRAAIQFLEQP